MNLMSRTVQAFAFSFSLIFVWLAALQAQAADSGGKPGEGGSTDYLMSYFVVFLAIALGLLVVASTSRRKTREGPAGYVEKKLVDDE
jgi:hypothetical protein